MSAALAIIYTRAHMSCFVCLTDDMVDGDPVEEGGIARAL